MDNLSVQKQADSSSDAKPLVQPDLVISNLEKQLANSKALLADALETCLRVRAEGENIKRRATEEVLKAHKFAVFSFAEAMIPIKDSMEMALLHDIPSAKLMKEGIEITLRQLTWAFEKHGVIEILPLCGDKFDAMRHQAVALVPAGNKGPNTVVNVLQKGYMIADRLLRPAIVTAAQEKTDGL